MFFRVAGRGDIMNYLTLARSVFSGNKANTGAGLMIDDLQVSWVPVGGPWALPSGLYGRGAW